MLKFELNEAPPAELESFYTPTDSGTFRLQVEGVVPASEYQAEKEKVKQFRATNTELLKKQSTLEAMEGIFGGEGGLKPAEVEKKINTLAQQRADSLVEQMKKAHEDRVKELEGGLSKKAQKLNELQLTAAVAAAAGTNGVKSSALEDVHARAAKAFIIDEDGNLKYKEDKLDADGKPYSVAAWMKDLAPVAPHFFESNQGTGAPKNGRTTSSVAVNNAPSDPRSDIAAGLANRNSSAVKRIN